MGYFFSLSLSVFQPFHHCVSEVDLDSSIFEFSQLPSLQTEYQ